MPHQALKPMRYAGVEYEAGATIPAMTERDAKVFIALRKVQLVADLPVVDPEPPVVEPPVIDPAPPEVEAAPPEVEAVRQAAPPEVEAVTKPKRYARKDMRAES